MKILFITYDFLEHGGIAGYMAKLADYFLENEQEVHLFTKHCEYRPAKLVVHKSSFKKFLELIPDFKASPRSPARIFSWTKEILDTCDNTGFANQGKNEFDIIHSNSTYSWQCDVVTIHNCQKVWTKIADEISQKKLSPVKRLFYKTGKWLPNRIICGIEKEVLEKGSRKIIAVSEGIKREILENYNVSEEKIVVIPPGVNLNKFEPNTEVKSKIRAELGVDQNVCLLMFSGGLDLERKGLGYLIQALPLVKDKVKLLITGTGDFQSYKELAGSLKVLDRIIFTGFVPKIKDYYAAADIFVFPSLYEAFPGVILEAAASGLPILTAKVNGAEEVVEDGFNGFFIKRNPEDMADKINLLADDEILRKQMGENVYKTAQKYSWEEIARKTAEVYKEVLETKSKK
ncbi:MAG: glycosyltransferase family 4 protein [bacterium]